MPFAIFGQTLVRGRGKSPLVGIATPNGHVQRSTVTILWFGWLLGLLLAWQYWPSALLPRPEDVTRAFLRLAVKDGLGEQLLISYTVQLEALAAAVVVTLILSYFATVPLLRPAIQMVSTLRFISLGPLVVFFSLLVSAQGHALKVGLLTFTITVFYVTSMLPVVLDVPSEELDHARTLHMGPWRSVWEVIVLGRADATLEMFRQNAAMGWMLLTMVEGLVRSEGGIGSLMLNQMKHFKLAEALAIIMVLFVVGFLQDQVIQKIRLALCPYADMEKERR